MFDIRRVQITDTRDVDAIFARTYPKLLKADYPPSIMTTVVPRMARARPQLMACPTYFVAETPGGQIIGAGGWTPIRGQTGRGDIRHFVTDDRYLRQGVAAALMDQTLGSAAAAGVGEMRCWSTRTARSFYEAQGFEWVRDVEVPIDGVFNFPAHELWRML